MSANGRGRSVRRSAWGAAVVLVGLCASRAPLTAQGVDEATTLLRTGKYAEAAAAFSTVLQSDDEWPTAQRGLVRSLVAVGKYDEAEAAARKATSAPKGNELWTSLGEVLHTRGKNADAEHAFERARAAHASDTLTAALDLAILHYERGDREKA